MDEKARNTAKEVLEHQHYRLTFEPADIKYIIISDETEIPTIVKAIAELEYDEPNRQGLLTRITSCKQIEEDF